MKVAVAPDGKTVVDIGKGTLRGRPWGEFIGLSAIGAGHVDAVRRVLARFAADPGRDDEWYEAAYREAIDGGIRFSAFEVGTEDWVEIDDEHDRTGPW